MTESFPSPVRVRWWPVTRFFLRTARRTLAESLYLLTAPLIAAAGLLLVLGAPFVAAARPLLPGRGPAAAGALLPARWFADLARAVLVFPIAGPGAEGHLLPRRRPAVHRVRVRTLNGAWLGGPACAYSRGMARVACLLVVACAVLATACTAGRTRLPHPPPVPGAAYTNGGCGATPLRHGPAPRWARSANPPSIPYALARRAQAAGFLFGYPLVAGNPQPTDKILWIVAAPRDGMPLRLTGHPLNAARPVVSSTWPADSAPGEIYPSDVEVPSPGCWRFTLSWNGHTDTVDLWYGSHRLSAARSHEQPEGGDEYGGQQRQQA